MITLFFSPSVDYVSHPIGKIPNIKKMIGHIGYCKEGNGYYITALSDRNKDKEVCLIDSSIIFARNIGCKDHINIMMIAAMIMIVMCIQVKVIAENDEVLYEAKKDVEIHFNRTVGTYSYMLNCNLFSNRF